jgi:hypothetical protein
VFGGIVPYLMYVCNFICSPQQNVSLVPGNNGRFNSPYINPLSSNTSGSTDRFLFILPITMVPECFIRSLRPMCLFKFKTRARRKIWLNHKNRYVVCHSGFPNDSARSGELPLPENYLVRGLVWAHDYLPKKWFERERDEEERYLELASTVKSRMQRVLRL